MIRRFQQFVLVVLGLAVAACSAAPRQRPVKMGDVDTGPGSAEYVRRQLSGRWQLTSLTIYSTSGQPTTVPAEALLTYDDYGNLTIRGQLKDPGSGEAPPILHQSGRAVIDPGKKQLRLMDTGGDALDPSTVSDAISYDRIRLYELSGQELKLTTIDANGNRTATTVWKKVS
jgi:hypothetical protein